MNFMKKSKNNILKKITMVLCTMAVTIGVIGSKPITANADTFRYKMGNLQPSKVHTIYYYVEGEKIKNLTPIEQWGNASSKFKLVKTTVKKNAAIVIYNKTQSNSDKAGTTKWYNTKGKSVNPNKENWSKVNIYIYKCLY